jgi:hypothetical protein
LNPDWFLFRYPLLLFICLLTFGSYYCYDTPAALEQEFQEVRREYSSRGAGPHAHRRRAAMS